MKYIKKAEILTKFFGVFGYGNFDLSIDEIAYILELLETKKTPKYLEINLYNFYEKIEKLRMG